MLPFIKTYCKSILWAQLILYLSLMNINEHENLKILLFPYSDKIAHIGVYAILTFILLYENKQKNKGINLLIISILYGILMEILQYTLTDYRSLEAWDIVANTSGSLTSFLIFKNRFK